MKVVGWACHLRVSLTTGVTCWIWSCQRLQAGQACRQQLRIGRHQRLEHWGSVLTAIIISLPVKAFYVFWGSADAQGQVQLWFYDSAGFANKTRSRQPTLVHDWTRTADSPTHGLLANSSTSSRSSRLFRPRPTAIRMDSLLMSISSASGSMYCNNLKRSSSRSGASLVEYLWRNGRPALVRAEVAGNHGQEGCWLRQGPSAIILPPHIWHMNLSESLARITFWHCVTSGKSNRTESPLARSMPIDEWPNNTARGLANWIWSANTSRYASGVKSARLGWSVYQTLSASKVVCQPLLVVAQQQSHKFSTCVFGKHSTGS